MADKPQETIQELKDLVVAYAKQETVEPLKGIGRYAGYGIGGALAMALGVFCLAIGALRALQTETGDTFDEWKSILPYVIVVVGLFILAGLAMWARGKRKAGQ